MRYVKTYDIGNPFFTPNHPYEVVGIINGFDRIIIDDYGNEDILHDGHNNDWTECDAEGNEIGLPESLLARKDEG